MEIISMDIRTFDALMARVKTIEEKADMLCKRQEDLGLKKWLDRLLSGAVERHSLKSGQTENPEEFFQGNLCITF